MFLTFKASVVSGKNDQGTRVARLSNRKWMLCRETAVAFSEAFREITAWGMAHFDEIPFTFPGTDKEGNPILDKEGKQKILETEAHYLANWLGSRCKLDAFPLHSKIKNGVRVKAASALISQYQLRQLAEDDPARLTGPDVGTIGDRHFRSAEVTRERADWLDLMIDPGNDSEDVADALEEFRALDGQPRLLPVHFAGPKDFLLFKHALSGTVFVCLPMFEQGGERADRSVKQKGVERLVPLRPGEEVEVPNSKQWLLLPLQLGEVQERLLADPAYSPRTAELVVKEDRLFVTITVGAPEAEPYRPDTFLGIRVGYYRIHWSLLGADGAVRQTGAMDMPEVQAAVEGSSAQHDFARARGRADRHPRYRGIIKLSRERIVNELVALAVKEKAAIGLEDVSGVDKSTKSGKANLFRSHWDFGRFVTVLTYKAISAGVPAFGRGSKRTLFQIWSGVVWKAVKDLPAEERDPAAAKFIAEHAREAFMKKLKRSA